MAKITELPTAGPIAGEETLPIVQDGETKQAPYSDLVDALTGAVAHEGAAQLTAIATAGSAISETANLYADALSTGALVAAYESIGNVSQANLASNVGVLQVGLINGTHVFTGDVIRAVRWSWACAATTTSVEIKVWKRNVAGATAAGTLNNAAPIATHDTLIGTYTTTPAALGVTVGTSNPVGTNVLALPSIFTIEAGYDYIFQFRNLDATTTVVNCGFQYFATAAGTQRRAGFQALTATPNVFTNLTATRTPAISLYKGVQATQLPATDATLRTLINQRDSETLAAMNQRNVQNLYVNATLFPNALAVPASFWGDSLTFDAIGTPTLPGAGFKATDVADVVTTGTVNNYGINGQTSTEITARVTAASATDKGGFNQVMMGANDTNDAAKTAALILADFATCAGAFTNASYLFCSPWNSGPVVAKNYDVRRGLISTYGPKALDMSALWARHAGGSSDVTASRRGAVPTDLTADGIHQNQAGGLVKGYEWAAALVARNGGAPFVHDDMFGFKANDASGTAIGTVRTLGTGYNFRILAGNEDGAAQMARGTGALTRTANSILQPYRELFVEAENNKGRGRNGRVILVQQMDGTSPQRAVQVAGNGASVAYMPTTFAPADGTQLTIVACLRVDIARTNGYLISKTGSAPCLLQQNSGMTFAPKNNAGVSLGTITGTAQNPSEWHFYFFTINTATGVISVAVDEVSSSGAASAGNIELAALNTFFTNAGGNTLPWAGGIKMLAVYGAYYDITSAAVRANWYDSATRLPKDIGASGTAGGSLATPLIYMRGRAGDYLLGKNYGNGGDLHVPVPIGRAHLGFVDLDA